MQHSPANPVRRVVSTATITASLFALSAAAALPALADHVGNHPNRGHARSVAPGQSNRAEPGQAQAGNKQAGNKGSKQARNKQTVRTRSVRPGHSTKPKAADPTAGNGPRGNNGHVFIKQSATDQSPGNQPHVSCDFAVTFFGFDRNQVLALSLDGHAPSGSGHVGDASFTVPGNVSTTGNTFDGAVPFASSDLDLSGLTAQPKQGYHLRLTVATNEPGGHKYKLFWLQPCQHASSDETTQPGVAIDTTSAAVADTSGQALGGTSVLAAHVNRPNVGIATTAAAQAVPGAAAGAASLPFTGAEIGLMLAAGIVALGGGTALLVAGRRRCTAAIQE